MLGTSRGPVDIGRAVENLIARGVNILFTVGGDGTQRGGNDLFRRRASADMRSPSSACRRRSTTTCASSRAPSASSPPSRKRCASSTARTPRRAACPADWSGEADGPPRGLHHCRRHGREPGREFRLIPEVPVQARELSRRARSSGCGRNRTPSSPSRRAPARTCSAPTRASATPPAT